MPLFLQSKLLRVLQDGSFRSLGGSETKRTNVKIIAATNVEPLEAIEKGQLRRDIYYRLSCGNGRQILDILSSFM